MKFKSRWRWIKKIRLMIDSTNSSIYRTNEWNSGRKRNTYTDDNWMTSIEVENKWFNTRMIYLKSGKKREQARSYLEGETERIQCWYWNVNKPINWQFSSMENCRKNPNKISVEWVKKQENILKKDLILSFFLLDLFEDTKNKMIVSDTWKTFILTIMKLIIYL